MQLETEIFDSIDANGDEKSICDQVSALINAKINKHINCTEFIENIIINENNPIEELENLVVKLKDELDNYDYSALLKIEIGNYLFLQKNNNTYKFCFSYLVGLYKNKEFLLYALKDLIELIQYYQIIDIINDITYIDYVETKLQEINKKVLFKSRDFIYDNFGKIKYIFKIFPASILLFLILVLAKISNIYILYILPNTQQSISLSIVGALTSFLGFLVVFLQISFENKTKILASYAKKTIINGVWNDLGFIFLVSVISSLATALTTDYDAKVRDVLFNLSIVEFIVFLCVLMPKIKILVNNTINVKELHKLLDSINIKSILDVGKQIKIEFLLKESIDFYDNNPISIANEIINHNIAQGNNKMSRVLIIGFTDKYLKVLKEYSQEEFRNQLDCEISEEEIINVYLSVLRKIFDGAINQRSIENIEVVFEGIMQLCFHACVLGYNIKVIRNIFRIFSDFIKKIQEQRLLMISSVKKFDESLEFLLEYYDPKLHSLNLSYYFRDKEELTKLRDNEELYFSIWFNIEKLFNDDYFGLINFCYNQLFTNDPHLLTDIFDIYKARLSYFTHSKLKVGREQIRQLIPHLCYNTYYMYRKLYKIPYYSEGYISNPFESFIVESIAKENKEFLIVYFNYWYQWNLSLIQENNRIPGPYSDYYHLLRSLANGKLSELGEQIFISTLSLYNVTSAYYDKDSGVISISKKELEIIENQLNDKKIENFNIKSALKEAKLSVFNNINHTELDIKVNKAYSKRNSKKGKS